MRARAPAVALAAATLAGCTCATPPAPVLASVDPARVAAGVDTPLAIRGSGFFPFVRADLDHPAASEVDAGFRLELANGGARVPLDAVALVSEGALVATLRAGTAALGTYDLLLVDPRGRTAALAAALTVAECVPDGSACTDGNACTAGDTCTLGACVPGGAVACPSPPACRTIGTCDPTTGACSAPQPVANGTDCDDGDPCTGPDVCQAGSCYGPLLLSCTSRWNTPPTACLAVRPASGIGAATGATTFTLDAGCSTDAEDGANLRFRFAYDYAGGTPAWVPATPSSASQATTSYATPGVRTVAVEVTDQGTPQGAAYALRAYAYRTIVLSADDSHLVWVTTALDENDGGATPANPGNEGLSLREAVKYVNGPPAREDMVIAFALATPVTIRMGSRLPELSGARNAIVGLPDLTVDFTSAGQPASSDCLRLAGADQKLLGLTIVGCSDVAVGIPPNRTGTLVADCTIVGPGIGAGPSSVGISVQSPVTVGPRNDVSGCYTGVAMTAAGSAVDGNRVHGNVVGIAISGGGATIQRNEVFGNAGPGVRATPSTAEDFVHFNTFDGNTGDGVYAWNSVLDVRNNLFTSNRGWGLNAPGCTFSPRGYNGYFGNGTGAIAGLATDATDVVLDPLYFSPPAADYRLRVGSPAIDRGVDVGVDVNGPDPGNCEGQCDLGAHEYLRPSP